VPTFQVSTAGGSYPVVVGNGLLAAVRDYLPRKHGKVFVVTEEGIWRTYGHCVNTGTEIVPLFLPGGEENKRLAPLEVLADEMVSCGADRSSLILTLGGGIVNDMGGFLAAIFMRGVPVIQIPTTLLAQVDAAVGGKTGVNLVSGKNLIGSFHQPLAVLIDPSVLSSLPDREYRAGLYEVIKCGVIASPWLFELLEARRDAVLGRDPETVQAVIGESVRVKAEVVSEDERESGRRRILNFGHTIGHALEAETLYERFLHGEAVAFGMRVATFLAERTGRLTSQESSRILQLIEAYGPIPSLDGIELIHLVQRLGSDKKTIQGRVHFVLPVRVGETEIVSGLDDAEILRAVDRALSI
jgi:3-dehydroquinate synthase